MPRSLISCLVILFVTSLPAAVASAQKAPSVAGYVKTESGEPLPGATVSLLKTPHGVSTDANGFFAFPPVKAGSYTVQISLMGYVSVSQTIPIEAGQTAQFNATLQENQQNLNEVSVYGKTETQSVKEQAFTVNAIETKPFQNTTADLNQVLNRSAGVRIREAGGLGSSFNFSINGLSGKAVKYFIDGVPMEVMGSAMSLNNIPVNLSERIEVYKGVVPVQLGSDAMGGAVNVITNQKQTNYLDVSHSYGSFNTHRSAMTGQYVHRPTGITIKASGFFNYSDNNYTMEGVEILEGGQRNGDQIVDLSGANFVTTDVKRFHDHYRSGMSQVEVGITRKSWADVLYAGFGYSESRQDQQTGFEQAIVYGNVARKGKSSTAMLRYKKNNLIVNGLDVNLFASLSSDKFLTADTLLRQYYWDGSWTTKGATEMGGIKSLSHIIRPRAFLRANATYTLHERHSLNLNYTIDCLKNENYNELLVSGDDMPGVMTKQILGLAYQQELADKRWTNTFFAKYYGLGLERKKWIDNAYQVLIDNFPNYGYGIATRYKILPDFGVKLSLEHTFRLQEVEEVFGDGLNVQPNPDLKPERSDNLNLGSYYGFRTGKHRLFAEAAGFYRNASDFIYPVADQRSKALKNENKSDVRVTGFEAELRYDYADLLSFHVNATYQSAVNMTKFGSTASNVPEATYRNKIPNQPWFFGNAHFGIGKSNVFAKGSRLQFSWFTQYVHWFYLTWEAFGNVNGKSTIPTQLIHNTTLSYSFRDGRYNVSAECRNLTDELAYDNFRLQKPGRAFALKLRYFIQ